LRQAKGSSAIHSRLLKATQAYSRVFGKKLFIFMGGSRMAGQAGSSPSQAVWRKKKIVYFLEGGGEEGRCINRCRQINSKANQKPAEAGQKMESRPHCSLNEKSWRTTPE
jgi:hypothetical protein